MVTAKSPPDRFRERGAGQTLSTMKCTMEATGPPSTHFSVLGPLRARRDGTDLDLGSPQQRAVAAVLVLRHDRAVSMDGLVGALWESPPRRPKAVVRTYVWRLRHLLEPARTEGEAWCLMQSVPGGYSLAWPTCWALVADAASRARDSRSEGRAR